jgi:hypothetical protein
MSTVEFTLRDAIRKTDWARAAGVLYDISLGQVTRFLEVVPAEEVYGLGYFCDAFAGVVYLVGSTSTHDRHHRRGIDRLSPADDELLKWDIGNWQYPGGLFPSASPEQREFDTAWSTFGRPLSERPDDLDQQRLEEMCVQVLSRLVLHGAFARARRLEGFVVAGPDDTGRVILEKKRRLDLLLDRA